MVVKDILERINRPETILFISKKYHNTAGLFTNQGKYNIVRVHSDDLAFEPENYLKVSSELIRENSYDEIPRRSSFFYPNVMLSKDFYELVDGLNSRGPLYFLDYSSTSGIENIMQGKGINLGVSHNLSRSLDKIDQFELLRSGGFDLPKFYRGKNSSDIHKYFSELNNGQGVFIAGRGSGGSGVYLSKNPVDLVNFAERNFYDSNGNFEDFLIEEGLDLKASISLDLLISQKGEVLPYCASESLFGKNILGCVGSIYPINLGEKVKKEIYDYAYKTAKYLHRTEGVSGEVNVDFNILNDDSVKFCEWNLRPGASTGNKHSHLEAIRPINVPSMTELLVMAKTGEEISKYLPGGELWEREDIAYIRKRIKVSEGTFVAKPENFNSNPDKIFSNNEFSIFKEGYSNPEGAWGIIGLPPKGTEFREDSELGKLIIVSRNREAALEKLSKLEEKIIKKIR